jgi:hypothetical protein
MGGQNLDTLKLDDLPLNMDENGSLKSETLSQSHLNFQLVCVDKSVVWNLRSSDVQTIW